MQVVVRPHLLSNREQSIVGDIDYGMTVAEVVDRITQIDDKVKKNNLAVLIDGHTVPTEFWHERRLLRTDSRVEFAVVLRGGGGSGKQILGLVAIIALSMFAPWAAGALTAGAPMASTGLLYGVASYGVVKAGIMLAGTLLIHAIFAPPRTNPANGGEISPTYTFSGQSNSPRRFSRLPRIYGRHRYTADLAAMPYTTTVGDDTYLYVLYCFGYGPLTLEDFRIGQNPLTNYTDYDIRVHNLTSSDELLLYRSDVWQDTVQFELKQSAPVTVTTQPDAEFAQVDITFPQGLVYINDDGDWEHESTTMHFEYRESGTTGAFLPIGIANQSEGLTPATMKLVLTAPELDGIPDQYRTTIEGEWQSFTVPGVPAGNLSMDAWLPLDVNGRMNLVPGSVVSFAGFTMVVQTVNERIASSGPYNGMATRKIGSLTYQAATVTYTTPTPTDLRLSEDNLNAFFQYTTDTEFNDLGTSELFLREKRAKQFTISVEFRFPAIGQYEIRITKREADYSDEDQHHMWRRFVSAVKTFKNIPPIEPEVMLSIVELKIKATGQLSGTIEQFSATATSHLRQWSDALGWHVAKTSNPAWVYLDVLQGSANNRPLPDARIDLTAFRQWAVICDTINPPFTEPMGSCNVVVDNSFTVWELLQNVAATGRAAPVMRDNKYSIMVDSAERPPVQMFTPRNSRGLRSVRTYLDEPHALRVKWMDPLSNWQPTETIIYNTGRNVSNSTVFEELPAWGMTRAEQVLRWGRYMLAQGKLRQERFSIDVDIENIVCMRGDLVYVAHDVIEVGGAASRIVEVAGQRLYVDAPPTLDTVTEPSFYGIRVRRSDGFIGPVLDVVGVGNDGEFDYIDVSGDVSQIIADNLLVFGPKSQVVGEYVVDTIRPNSELGATISLEEYAPGVYQAEYTGLENLNYVPQGGGMGAPAVQNMAVTILTVIQNGVPMGTVRASWRPAQGYSYQPDSYRVWMLTGSGNEQYLGETTAFYYEVGPYDLTTLNGYEFIFRVRPFYGARGLGPVSEASIVVEYVPNVPPPLMDFFDVVNLSAGGRRYVWSFDGPVPANVVGIRVRYMLGEVPLPTWNAGTEVIANGSYVLPNGIELSSPPGAGMFTFMARTVNQKGVLSADTYVLIQALDDQTVIDLTPPPTPTGFTAVGGYGAVFFGVDEATYTTGGGHNYTQVYAAEITGAMPNPTFEDAKQFTAFPGIFTSAGAPAATHYRFWAKWVSNNNVESIDPTDPIDTEVSIDIPAVLDALEGMLTETQLHQDLNERIDLIDGDITLPGSVNARISAETTARIADVNQETADRIAAVQAEADARGTAVANEAWVREQGDTALATQMEIVTATSSAGFDNFKAWYYDTTVEGWTASNATLVWRAGGWVDINATANAPRFDSPTNLGIDGSLYNKIRARITRIAGDSWSGRIYYNTSAGPNAGHGFTSAYVKAMPDPTSGGLAIGETTIIEWDMAALTAGGNDWIQSTISQLRVELGAVAADKFSVDWLAVGRSAPPASVAGLVSEQSARITADTAIATDVTALTARVGTTESGLVTEQTARANADTALANSLTALTAKVEAEFDTAEIWNYDTSVEGWTSVANATLAHQAGGYMRMTATGAAAFHSPNIAVNGSLYPLVRFRITRVAGTGWGVGRVYYKTAGHGETVGFYKDIPNPNLVVGQSSVVELDMTALTAGGVDWTANTITGIRFDFGNSTTGDVFDIDWASIGRKAPAASHASLVAEQSVRASADTAIANDVTALTARVGTAEGAIVTEQTARANADSALASQITNLTASSGGGFDNYRVWNFDTNGNAEGWTINAANGSFVIAGGLMTITHTAADVFITSPGSLNIPGGLYRKVLVRLRRVAGTGWDGTVFYITASHNILSTFRKAIPKPVDLDSGIPLVLEWDMGNLTAGGTDWIDSTILSLRIDLGNSATDVFEVDWIAVGRPGPAASQAALATEQTVRSNADTAIAGDVTALTSRVSTAESAITTEQTTRANADTALSSRVTIIEAHSTAGFDTINAWNFDTSADGFVAGNSAVLTASNGVLNVADNGTLVPYIMSAAGLAINGRMYDKVRARVTRRGGTTWRGIVYYSTSGHGFVGGVSGWWKQVTVNPVPNVGDTAIVEWDMANLNAGGTDWLDSIITRIRFDLAASVDDEFDFDWIAVGRSAPAASNASLAQEQTARTDGDSALATDIRILRAQTDGEFYNSLFWGFDADAQGWVSGNATVAWASTGEVVLTSTAANPAFISPAGLTIVGADFNVIRAKVTWTSGGAWEGNAYYVTGGHGISVSFRKQISMPAGFGVGKTAVLEWDMSELTAGGTDWTDNTVTQIRLDVLDGTTLGALRFDWVAVGRRSSATAAALKVEQTARADADSAQASSITTLQASVANSKAATVFTETWDGTSPLSQWEVVGASPEMAVITGASPLAKSGQLLRVGDNTGNDQVWLVHKELIPFDPDRLYAMSVSVMRNLGSTGTVFAGFAGVAADKVTLVNATGANSHSSQHFIAAANDNPGNTTWTTWTGYLKGHAGAGVNGSTVEAPDPQAPGKMYASVRYIRPLIVVNYNGATGQYLVGRVEVKDGTPSLNSVLVQEETTVRADETGDLFAQHTVKIDANGYVTGYGLASTTINATPTSTFSVRSDSFYVASPSGPGIAPSMPFIVRTVAGSQNGQTIPIGVYMRAAFIENGAITTAKIGLAAITTALIGDAQITTAKIGTLQVEGGHIKDATITTAKIGDAQITAAKIGTLQVQTGHLVNAAVENAKIGNYIASAGFDGGIDGSGNITNVGTTGWAISKGGKAVFTNVHVRKILDAISNEIIPSVASASWRGSFSDTGTWNGSAWIPNPTGGWTGALRVYGSDNHVSVPMNQRCRHAADVNYPVAFIITVTGIVDVAMTLWYRVNTNGVNGTWVKDWTSISEGISGDGFASISTTFVRTLGQNQTIDFAVTASQANDTFFDSTKRYVNSVNFTINVVNV